MKIKPILFSKPMVESILEIRKTQTRRTQGLKLINEDPELWDFDIRIGDQFIFKNKYDQNNQCFLTPKFLESDILWVRETWRVIGWSDNLDEMLVEYKDGETSWCPVYDPDEDSTWLCNYVENLAAKGCLNIDDKTERYVTIKKLPWKPSIFMPKQACRIFLEVTYVRVERLRDISEEDANSEGIYAKPGSVSGAVWYEKFIKAREARIEGLFTESAKECFQTLWQSINGKESWEANPFVFVYNFKQVERPTNFLL